MSIRRELLDGLERLAGRAVPVAQLARHPRRRNVVALRHDVDHDLDLALELAAAECERGVRASYFLLHTAPYWRDPHFDVKVRQLCEYGHEVGLHVNVLAEWHRCVVDDVEERIAEVLARLRKAAPVAGVSAHGDRHCYAAQLINNWLWAEARGRDPATTEAGLSPEGVPTDDPERQIEYPTDDILARPDRRTFPLWSVSQASHGIEYDAAKTRFEAYWSDTGGKWHGRDPFDADLSTGRHQILVHPWWWRDEPRAVFCLSTARSGSKWLAGMVDAASSAAGFHDWTLNHERNESEYFARPRTRFEYRELVDDPREAARLIRVGAAHRRSLKRDSVEANTYLEPFVRYLRAQDPRPTIVHLHRDGRNVVRSILERGWYSTPVDPSHRVVPIPGWDELTQLERACWYVRYTQERLMEAADHSISLERATQDAGYLARRLAALGIVLHPLLAEGRRGRVDRTKRFRVPPFGRWPSRERATFERICGPVQIALGYETGADWVTDPADAPEMGADMPARGIADFELSAAHAEVRRVGTGILCRVPKAHPNAHALLGAGAGAWQRMRPAAGIRCERDGWAVCTVRTRRSTLEARVFALYYGRDGEQVGKREIGVLRSSATAEMPLAPPPKATHCAVALHFGGRGRGTLDIAALELRWFRYPPGYRAGAVGLR
ncbi:MAG: hypothetical protein WD993_10895 [Thermoleophilaceae bacterium]